MKHFCIDIDNTIAQTDEVMRRVISDYTDGRVQLDYGDIVAFNYYECKDSKSNCISRAEWKEIHELFSQPKYLMGIKPMPGAVEGLAALAQNGIVHIATTRLRQSRKATVEWLDLHSMPEHNLHFLKHSEKHASLRPFVAAVEDHYEQAVDFATKGQTPCYLIRHPWNKQGPPMDDVRWVDDWQELTALLLALPER